ncbi:MAG: glmU [Candidatus Paceibacter sp.]|jgi:bifunctional UDP-N-acetylglucosamine pyrophosphorylase/glucosamine-1-phosphate N-acetyltransferase|nr:glmU [Candidatus Paceibacter sp.]
MKSDLPKVLHPVKGIPIIKRLLSSVTQIDPKPTLIVGHKAQEVIDATDNLYHYVEQTEQLGTGHAVQMVCEALKNSPITTLVVLPGDHPLVSVDTINKLIETHSKSDAAVSLGTAKIAEEDPRLMIFNNYGRIIRDSEGHVNSIVEYKDATEEQRAVKEFNLSYYCFDFKWLCENISKLTNNNASKEYYLTDMVHMAIEQGRHVDSYAITNVVECLGINSPEQLAMVEEAIQEPEAVLV